MRYLLFLAAALSAHSQIGSRPSIYSEGTQTKASAAEYPVHATSGNLTIGADYMVHSFGSGEQMYLAENYLVVEVALYPPKGESITAERRQFHASGEREKDAALHAESPDGGEQPEPPRLE